MLVYLNSVNDEMIVCQSFYQLFQLIFCNYVNVSDIGENLMYFNVHHTFNKKGL
jgi:hypothetical protein